MDVRSTKADIRSELKSIKQDLMQLASFVDRVVERISKLESSVEASSRKRHAPREVDSDAFSEDDQSMQPKLLKMEQEFKTNLSSNNNNNVSLNGSSSVGVKVETNSRPFLANATKPVAIPRPSTSATSSSSSSSSFSASSSSKAAASASTSKPFSASSIGSLIREDNRVIVYTDGSCTNNGKPNAKAGIGVYFNDNSPLNFSAPLPGKQSNNRAELQAAVKALMIAREKKLGPVQIRTDSGYVKQGITSWIKTWKTNGWRTAGGNEVKNVEDWKELDAIQLSLDVEWQWVEAHKGIHGNEMADRLANEGAGNKR